MKKTIRADLKLIQRVRSTLGRFAWERERGKGEGRESWWDEERGVGKGERGMFRMRIKRNWRGRYRTDAGKRELHSTRTQDLGALFPSLSLLPISLPHYGSFRQFPSPQFFLPSLIPFAHEKYCTTHVHSSSCTKNERPDVSFRAFECPVL